MQRKPVTVVGAGFSGLASAFYLSRAGFDVDVYESLERPGGLLSTHEASFGLVETAANALLNSAKVEELFGLLSLKQVRVQKEARRRYIYRAGRPRRWPLSAGATLRVAAFLFRYSLLRKSLAPKTGETLRAWGTRTLGLEASMFLVETALQGIYAGDPERLSAKLVLEAIFDRRAVPAKGSFSGSVSAEQGMGQLMLRWRERLEQFGVRFHFHSPRAALDKLPSAPMILAVPAYAAAEILKTVDPARSRALAAIEFLPLVSVTAAFREPPKRALGFGCLFPWGQGRRALGVLMNGLIFPNRAKKGFSETWMIGGAHAEMRKIIDASDQEILNLISEEQNTVFGSSGEMLGSRITRWPQALPHYSVELEKVLPELTGMRQNVMLVGNYLGGIGLSKILERAALLPEQVRRGGEWDERSE